jgi:putative colanic acid biosynthesis acetyltransferase WcaF
MVLWEYLWQVLCAWTPKPLNPWRLFWLRRFGARINGTPFVHQRARIQIPWHLTLHHRCCIGDRANLYSLGEIEIGAGAVVAQEAYLCTGTHDFSDATLPLITSMVFIGKGAFIGARAFVLPGVTIGEGAIIGACAVVTSDVAPFTISAGNPARFLKRRDDAPKLAEAVHRAS